MESCWCHKASTFVTNRRGRISSSLLPPPTSTFTRLFCPYTLWVPLGSWGQDLVRSGGGRGEWRRRLFRWRRWCVRLGRKKFNIKIFCPKCWDGQGQRRDLFPSDNRRDDKKELEGWMGRIRCIGWVGQACSWHIGKWDCKNIRMCLCG